MKVEIEEFLFYHLIDCCKKFEDGMSTGKGTRKLIIKDGLIICPLCRKPIDGEIHLNL